MEGGGSQRGGWGAAQLELNSEALGHYQAAGAFCKSACQKGTWPLPTSMCFLKICLSERHLATFNQLVLFANLHVRSPVGHFQPASEFALR